MKLPKIQGVKNYRLKKLPVEDTFNIKGFQGLPSFKSEILVSDDISVCCIELKRDMSDMTQLAWKFLLNMIDKIVYILTIIRSNSGRTSGIDFDPFDISSPLKKNHAILYGYMPKRFI